jgi:hypothetical protein
MNVLAARRKVLSGIVAALVLLGLIVPAALAATPPPLNLPSGSVTVASYGTYLDPAQSAAFNVTFTGIVGSYDVANSPTAYRGWCLEDAHLVNSTSVTLWSSYASNLPANLAKYTDASIPKIAVSQPPELGSNQATLNGNVPWDKLNYLLNHPPAATGGNTSAQITQAAVKLLIYGQNTLPVLSQTALDAANAAVKAANDNGAGFVPAPGQIIGVILDAGGITGNTADFQDAIIELTVPPYFDRGDLPYGIGGAPDYPTYIAQNGPSHLVGPDLYLGACVDAEADGQPNAGATGDNIVSAAPSYGTCATGGNDEDGVTRVAGKGGSGWTNGTVVTGGGGAVQVTITGSPACLGAFFDLARDGNLPLATLRDTNGNAVTQPIAAGTYIFYFDIPNGTFNGTTGQPIYARFRVASPVNGSCVGSTAFSPTGQAPSGEVEDYQWNFGPNAVTLSGMTASSAATPLALPLGIVTLLGVLVGGIVLARRPV